MIGFAAEWDNKDQSDQSHNFSPNQKQKGLEKRSVLQSNEKDESIT